MREPINGVRKMGKGLTILFTVLTVFATGATAGEVSDMKVLSSGSSPIIKANPPGSGMPVAYSRGFTISVISPNCRLSGNTLYCGGEKVGTYYTATYYFDDHKRYFKDIKLSSPDYFVVRIYDRDGQAIVFRK